MCRTFWPWLHQDDAERHVWRPHSAGRADVGIYASSPWRGAGDSAGSCGAVSSTDTAGEGGEWKGLLTEIAEVCHASHIEPDVDGSMDVATELVGIHANW